MKPRSAMHMYLAAATAMLLLGGTALADAVKLSGFWIQDINIRSIQDGRLVYTTATGGEVTKPLTEVEGIRIQLHPEIEQAQKAGEAGDHARAVTLLRQASRRARPGWVSHYVSSLLVSELADAGDLVESAKLFVELARSDADAFFLSKPPTAAVAAAGGDVKERVAAVIQPAVSRVTGDRRAALQRLLDAAVPASEEGQPAAAAPAAPATDANQAAVPQAAPESAVTLPQVILSADAADPALGPIIALLQQGRFSAALEAAQTAAESSGRLSSKLYLLGMAQLALAEESGDAKRYKDAGLSFMRVAIYFPRSGVMGPAMLEAGYVHEKIGREDQARKLYDRARLLIDSETDPAYHQRLLTVSQ